MFKYRPLMFGMENAQFRLEFAKLKIPKFSQKHLNPELQVHSLCSPISGCSLRQELRKTEKESVCMCRVLFIYLNHEETSHLIAGV